MAWIRTALSMIGSGFALYKFFQYLPKKLPVVTSESAGAPQSGANPYYPWALSISGRSLAASGIF